MPQPGQRPYRFGRFYGVLSMAWGVLYLFLASFWLAGSRPHRLVEAAVLAVSAIPLVVGGLGLLKRRRYGLYITLAELWLDCLLLVFDSDRTPLWKLEDHELVILSMAILVFAYFYKRREEFK
jgi:uncharacterized membrane protein